MKYNHIKSILSAALLLAFTVPSAMAYPSSSYGSSYGSQPSPTSTVLSGDVNLTKSNNKITLSLRDSDVKQVLRMFADKAGMNIVFHSSVSGKITLDLVDMPINEAFSLVLQVSGLNYYEKDNTLVILSKNNSDNAAFSRQEMMVFPIKYVSAASVAQFLNKNVFAMQKTGMSGVEAATVNSATNEVIIFGMPSDEAIVRKVIDQLDKEPLNKTFTLSHTTPKEMADMICNMLLPAHGSSSTSGSERGGSVTRTPGVSTGGAAPASSSSSSSSSGKGGASNVVLGEGVVACQTTQKSAANASGNIAFEAQNVAIAYYPSRGAIMMLGGSVAQQNMVEEFIRANDIKQRQAYVEMSVVELSEEGSKEFQNNWSIHSKNWNVTFSNGRTSGGREASPLGQWYDVTKYSWTDGRWSTDGTTYTPPAFYAVTGKEQGIYNGGAYISWTMNYLIENKKGRVLANPKILITNGQLSTIDLTEDYVEKVTSEFLSSTSNGSGASGSVQKTYTIGDDKGIKISLVPFISPDGYVTMNIKPEYSTEAGKEYSTNTDGSKDVAATLLNRRKLDLKNVRIKDGETLVIGGLIRETDMKTVQKIPVLGDLPIIGAAFRSSSTGKTKTELVIMITPKIINDGDDTVADRL